MSKKPPPPPAVPLPLPTTTTGGDGTSPATPAAAKVPSPGMQPYWHHQTPPKTIPPKTKKRPYRRTMRPKNYCDKSTITTTTAAVTQQNAYDAVLAESRDLWQAAAEAQQLGRLKMASAYLLLLHARLVGLGKRFDKAAKNQQQLAHDATQPIMTRQTELTPATPKTRAAHQLAQMLPNNIELDTAMMEHLARAAAELHAARSGRKRQVLESPDTREFLALTANQQGLTNATTMGVAWTRREVDAMLTGLAQGLTAEQMARQLSRTEQQVKSFIRNRNERARIVADLDLATTTTAAMEDVDEEDEEDEDDEDDFKKKGIGRGRKPATTAMNTVPNANCDARTLLQGGFLERKQEQEQKDEEEESHRI